MPVVEIFPVVGKIFESLAIRFLLLLPSAEDLLRGNLGLDLRAFLKFKIGHAEGVGGLGEWIIFIFHNYKSKGFSANVNPLIEKGVKFYIAETNANLAIGAVWANHSDNAKRVVLGSLDKLKDFFVSWD